MPYHSVVLSAYEIDRTEVTQGSYQACVMAGVCVEPERNWDPIDKSAFPVTNVSWDLAATYCGWVGKRLPTEAEWEKAARGPDGWIYPWGNATPDCAHANLMGCAGMTVPATSVLGASPYDVLHLAGNVTEWVADWYALDAYGDPDVTDPTGPADGVAKVLRGGSFLSDANSVRSSFRGQFLPGAGEDTFGFRCARSVATAPGVD
jgi:formylglycine-generating enzyme required for sulfatase activity